MTDGVARNLEQAEARLVEAREEAWDASRRLLAAAIEVGRLRALSNVDGLQAFVRAVTVLAETAAKPQFPEYAVTDFVGAHREVREWLLAYPGWKAALAAREEVQG